MLVGTCNVKEDNDVGAHMLSCPVNPTIERCDQRYARPLHSTIGKCTCEGIMVQVQVMDVLVETLLAQSHMDVCTGTVLACGQQSNCLASPKPDAVMRAALVSHAAQSVSYAGSDATRTGASLAAGSYACSMLPLHHTQKLQTLGCLCMVCMSERFAKFSLAWSREIYTDTKDNMHYPVQCMQYAT